MVHLMRMFIPAVYMPSENQLIVIGKDDVNLVCQAKLLLAFGPSLRHTLHLECNALLHLFDFYGLSKKVVAFIDSFLKVFQSW